jgi:serine phosphatase RsbU (regulator of sigma subunit)
MFLTEYERETVQLEPEDSVIFLSDGFSESQNTARGFFDMESCKRSRNRCGRKRRRKFLRHIREAVTSHSRGMPQRDDQTAAVLQYRPSL